MAESWGRALNGNLTWVLLSDSQLGTLSDRLLTLVRSLPLNEALAVLSSYSIHAILLHPFALLRQQHGSSRRREERRHWTLSDWLSCSHSESISQSSSACAVRLTQFPFLSLSRHPIQRSFKLFFITLLVTDWFLDYPNCRLLLDDPASSRPRQVSS